MLSAATLGAVFLALFSIVASSVLLWVYVVSIGAGGPATGMVLGIGAGVSVLVANFRAVLTGLGASREISLAGVVGAALALVLSSLVALASPSPVVLALAVACVPVGALAAMGRYVVPKVPRAWQGAVPRAVSDVLGVARRATVFTLAGVVPLLSQSITRTMVAVSMNEAELGHMQAAAAISAISTSLLATSIGPVLIPRLTVAVRGGEALGPILSQHVTFLVGLYAPVAVVIAGLPELILEVLYTGRFAGAARQLAWQVVGEVFRLPVWLLATTLVVRGRGRAYLMMELAGLLTQSLGLWVVLPMKSGCLIGVVFLAASFVQFLLGSVMLYGDRFRWTRPSLGWIGGLALTSGCLASFVAGGRGWILTLVALGPALAVTYLALRGLPSRRKPEVQSGS